MHRDKYYNTNPIAGGTKQFVSQYAHESNSISYGGFAAATPTQPETVVPHDRGRAKYRFEPTREQQFKPIRRKLEPHRCGADPARPEGKAYMAPPKLPDQVGRLIFRWVTPRTCVSVSEPPSVMLCIVGKPCAVIIRL